MKPTYFPVNPKLDDLRSKDPTQVNSWETMLLQASEFLSISEPHYKIICDRYETLQSILAAATNPLLQDAHIFVQGSIGLKTTIKTVLGATGEMATIDADAIVLLPHAGNASAEEVLAAIEERFREGTRVEAPIEKLRRGIRVVYADENPGFHMDITPARLASGNSDIEGFGNLEVPDRKTGWKASSPRSYSKWLDDVSKKQISVALDHAQLAKLHTKLAEATQEPMPEYDSYVASNPLRVAIKLIKRHRDEWAIRTKQVDCRPISAILTTLAAQAYEEVVAESAFKSVRPLEAIFKIVEKMPKFVKFDDDGTAYVRNPTNTQENFAEKWNRANGDEYKQAFSQWFASALEAFALGFTQLASPSEFEKALSETFGIATAKVHAMVNTLPKDWTLPGQKVGVSLNSLSTGALLGAGFQSAQSQAGIEPVKRLG